MIRSINFNLPRSQRLLKYSSCDQSINKKREQIIIIWRTFHLKPSDIEVVAQNRTITTPTNVVQS